MFSFFEIIVLIFLAAILLMLLIINRNTKKNKPQNINKNIETITLEKCLFTLNNLIDYYIDNIIIPNKRVLRKEYAQSPKGYKDKYNELLLDQIPLILKDLADNTKNTLSLFYSPSGVTKYILYTIVEKLKVNEE